MAEEQLTCVFHPIVNLRDFHAIGYELLSRGPRDSELHRPDALFDMARSEGRVTELDRLCRAHGLAEPASTCLSTPCASSTPNR